MQARISSLVITLTALSLASACGERKPDVKNPKSASAAGVSLEYPGNWKHEVEVEKAGGLEVTHITVESV